MKLDWQCGLVAILYYLPAALAAYRQYRAPLTADWDIVASPAETQSFTLRIGLRQPNAANLDSLLWSAANPGQTDDGRHWGKAEIKRAFEPSKDSVNAVESWLKKAGMTDVRHQGSWITLTASLKDVNRLLHADYKYFSRNGTARLRTKSYAIPADLVDHIDLVSPGTYFGPVHDKRQVTSSAETPAKRMHVRQDDCSMGLTPACLRILYNVTVTPSPDSPSRIGIANFLEESIRFADQAQYRETYGLISTKISVELINGAIDQQMNGNHYEANLDSQAVDAISNPLRIMSYNTAGEPPFIPDNSAQSNDNEPYLEFYECLLDKDDNDLPGVISISYSENEQTVPFEYAVKVCNMVGQLGLRGVTVIHSSGDVGVGNACKSNDGTNTTRMEPRFPSTCPYVTSVGGTTGLEQIPEAWAGSSGGFSYYFPRPEWQERALTDYFSKQVAPDVLEHLSPYFNKSGRGFPDVAAFAGSPGFNIVVNGDFTNLIGASWAAPLFAGVIGLVNDARSRVGKESLGFLNPRLYAGGYAALTDITTGGSTGCLGVNIGGARPFPPGKAGKIDYASWNATEGWDPVTGWGIPNVGLMLESAAWMDW